MNQNPANQPNPQQQVQQPIEQPKKKKRQGLTLKAEHFQKKNGFESLYKSVSQLIEDKNFNQNQIQLSMKKISVILKSWNYQLMPRFSFEYFLQRCRRLGEHKFTQAYMTKVRRIHKGQDQWQNVQQQGQQNVQQNLQNLDLDHLNPNLDNNNMNYMNNVGQSLEQKIQRAIKLVNQIQNPSSLNTHKIQQNPSQSMHMENENQISMQQNPQDNQALKKQFLLRLQQQQQQSDDDDDCQELFKQMQALQKQKKEILGKSKQTDNNKEDNKNKQINTNKKTQTNNKNQQQQEDIPYVPEGYQSVSYQPDSQNY